MEKNKFKGGRRIDFDGKDQYFTKRSVAKDLVEKTAALFDFSTYDRILEPSAGEGAFLDYLPTDLREGIDLEPQREDIIQQDFFEYSTNKKTLCIGNPPFGRKSSLAIKFFNHAAKFSDTIAFIVPITWDYYFTQKLLDPNFKLIFQENVEPFAFTKIGESPGKRHMEDGSSNINCVYQVWTKLDTSYQDLRKYQPDENTHPDFRAVGYFAGTGNLLDEDDYDFLIRAWGGMPFAKRGPGPLSTGTVHNRGTNFKGNWRMQYTGIKSINPDTRKIFETIPVEDWWCQMSSMNNITQILLVKMYKKYREKYYQKVGLEK